MKKMEVGIAGSQGHLTGNKTDKDCAHAHPLLTLSCDVWFADIKFMWTLCFVYPFILYFREFIFLV